MLQACDKDFVSIDLLKVNTHKFISFLQDGENAKKRANNHVIVTFIPVTGVLWSKV